MLERDGDAVGETLHLVELVRRQEHRPPGIRRLAHKVGEDALHDRAETRGGLVKDEQVGVVSEGVDQADLPRRARGQGRAARSPLATVPMVVSAS